MVERRRRSDGPADRRGRASTAEAPTDTFPAAPPGPPSPAVPADPTTADLDGPTDTFPALPRPGGPPPNGSDSAPPRAGSAPPDGPAPRSGRTGPPVGSRAGSPAGPGTPPPGAPRSGGSRRARAGLAATAARWRRPALVACAVLGVFAVIYAADLLLGQDRIPRGVRVSGISLAGMSRADAEHALAVRLAPRLGRDVPVQAGTVRTALSPSAAGLRVDIPGTVAAAARQPLNPFTRLSSLFTTREVDVVSDVDPIKLADALDAVNDLVRVDPTPGGVRFDGTVPTAVPPVPGRGLDSGAATTEITTDWTSGATLTLPLLRTDPPVRVTESAIEQTLGQVAAPAVANPVTVQGTGVQATLTPLDIARALSFTPDGSGGLRPVLDVPALGDAVRPRLASTEQPGRDASVVPRGGAPVVTPSVNGRGIDYKATFSGLLNVLKQPGDRVVNAVYADQPAKLTTEQVTALGIKGVIGTFRTGGFAPDSGQNIRRAAESINGTILRPGATFSLNGATGEREAAEGYVPAGIITDGRPGRGVGGGVSQLATTLYNAAYFAGLTDVAHQEHSYYISRYPPAREATVYEGAIDLRFRNDLPTGVLIETAWTPSDITVTLWGTKRYDVSSATSPRTDPVPPTTLRVPAGQPCTPSTGAPGFTATDTRTLREVGTGRVTTTSHTVHYKPSPTVVCGTDPGN